MHFVYPAAQVYAGSSDNELFATESEGRQFDGISGSQSQDWGSDGSVLCLVRTKPPA